MDGLRLIYNPTIHVIGQTVFSQPGDGPKVSWIANKSGPAPDGERLMEYAGRLCYLSFNNPAGKSTEEYITNILEQQHLSVVEHSNISLLIQGVSRSLTHELVRHRHFSFSQLSQRFVDESTAAFVVPPALIGENDLLESWQNSVGADLLVYQTLVTRLMEKYSHIEDKTHRRKIAREAARSVLPNATETKLVVTGNMRTWRHFLELRTNEHADREIRRLAIRILEVLRLLSPTVLKDFEIYKAADEQEAARFKYVGS